MNNNTANSVRYKTRIFSRNTSGFGLQSGQTRLRLHAPGGQLAHLAPGVDDSLRRGYPQLQGMQLHPVHGRLDLRHKPFGCRLVGYLLEPMNVLFQRAVYSRTEGGRNVFRARCSRENTLAE